MSSSEHHGWAKGAVARRVMMAAGLAGMTALGGCSADLGRFDLNGSSGLGSDVRKGGPSPIPAEPLRRNAGAPVDEPASTPAPPYTYNPGPASPPLGNEPVRQAGLPDPIVREPASPAAKQRSVSLPSSASTAPGAPPAGGTKIQVQQGDTLYGLSRRHRVAISELMSVNGLKDPTIRPGQQLVLPGQPGKRAVPARRNEIASASRGPASPAPQAASEPTSAPARIASPPPAAAVAAAPPSANFADWGGTHTVGPKDSLYGLAKKYNVKVTDLQAANGITDPTKMRAGAVLKVPGAASIPSSAATAPAALPPAAAAAPSAATAPAAGTGVASRPTIINNRAAPAERVAAVTPASPTASDATQPADTAIKGSPAPMKAAAAGPGKFRWPAKGRVVASFGPRGDNTHNDGINILVPQGTDVHAAEAGVVAYAGSELKGYGNLVLIRHNGNWVSAYAHNEQLLVKRGDKVTRGQAIAKAGKTGAVDQPQVHFELRQGSKPVDPMPHLEQ